MSSFAAERPIFFEGQYLGADDLAAIVDYLRVLSARENLGQHSWGIVAGLNMVSQPVDDTAVEYYLQPGVAVDGYGRIIVVLSPTLISPDLFVSMGSGNVDIWLRYDQSEFEATRAGFKVCSSTDSYARMSESFALEVGSKSSVLDRQSGVTVNNVLLSDAREARISVDGDAKLLIDASVPEQSLPIDDEQAYWLIPLGHVKWSAAVNNFLPLVDPAEKDALESGSGTKTPDQVYESAMTSRTKRVYAGAVAESIFASDGIIRLRERFVAPEAGKTNDQVCAESAVSSRDLIFCDGELRARELVWLEGNTRVTGNLRLFDSRLEFRDEEGRDYVTRTVDGVSVTPITPLLMQRRDANAKGGSDLQILLGESDDGINRLTVGNILFDGTDPCDTGHDPVNTVVFQDNGRVGIGTINPDTDLLAPLTLRGLADTVVENQGTSDETTLNVLRLQNFEGQGGSLEWQLDLWDDKESLSFNESGVDNARLYLQAGGNIGVGSSAPEAKLDIQKVEVSSGGSPLGNDLWLRIGDGGDAGRAWIEYGAEGAPLFVLSDRDDPPRIQFQQTDSENPDDDASPVHVSWFGHAAGASSNLALMGGLFGVGTDQPNAQLTVQGNGGAARFYSGQNSGHFWLGFYTDGVPGSTRAGWLGYGSNGTSAFSISNEKPSGDILLLTDGNVGVGTSSPSAKLQVNGDVKLGPTGNYYAMTAEPRMHTVAGRVNSGGTKVQGTGFTSARSSTGSYLVTFSPAFTAPPIVVASPYEHQDNVVSVSSVTNSTCTIVCYDVEGGNVGNQDIAFTFIAVGER